MLLFSCFFWCPDVPIDLVDLVDLVVLVVLGRQKCWSEYMWWNRGRKGDHIFAWTTRTFPVRLAFSGLVVSGSAAGKSGKERQGLRQIRLKLW